MHCVAFAGSSLLLAFVPILLPEVAVNTDLLSNLLVVLVAFREVELLTSSVRSAF
jgi:hypothetical protein